ncbi:MAG: COX15/CtaA family protein [Janthinobacterium lividum]
MNLKYLKAESKFQSVNLFSIIALFVLILAGGVVRSTGSGMGCPDWPKCFGRYIPPIKEAQLPENYRTEYIEKQLKKNLHFAKVLQAFGYTSLAIKVKADTFIVNRQQEEFNPIKTWTEYINRLVGVITGILLLATAFYSFIYLKKCKLLISLSMLNLLLVIFQAWLGSIVVSSNLLPWIVTAHMLIALAILAISIYTWFRAKFLDSKVKIRTNVLVIICMWLALILDIIQITIGTEVREKIDGYATKLNGDNRQSWVNGAGEILFNHKNMALAVVLVNVVLYLLLRKYFEKNAIQRQLMSASFILIMLQIFAGVLLSYWSLPPFAQAAHILLASLLFGAQFYLLLNLYQSAETLEEKYNVG